MNLIWSGISWFQLRIKLTDWWKLKRKKYERADHLICIMSSLGKLLRKMMWNMGNFVKLFCKKVKKKRGLTVKSRRASIPSLFLENVISLKSFRLFLILHFIFDLYLTPFGGRPLESKPFVLGTIEVSREIFSWYLYILRLRKSVVFLK